MRKLIPMIATTILISGQLFAEPSKDEIKSIAKRYSEACKDQDYDSWKEISENDNHDSDFKSHKDYFEKRLAGSGFYAYPALSKIRVKEVDGYNICIKISTQQGEDKEGWLQLCDDGKIKYDPILNPHPLTLAFFHFSKLEEISPNANANSQGPGREYYYKYLKQTGIPLFGLDLKADSSKQKESQKQIEKWLKKESINWDKTEPKLPLPEDAFKECLKQL
jgi:hypothetical protein